MADAQLDSPGEITAPIVEHPKIEKPGPAVDATADLAQAAMANAANDSVVAREPIHMPPAQQDAAAATIPGVEPVHPPAPVKMPTTPAHQALADVLTQLVHHLNSAPPTVNVQPSLVVTPEAFKKAEQNLAAFVGAKIASKELTPGLIFTLGNEINHDNPNVTEVTLAFSGPTVAPNIAELHKELMEVFNTHPELGKFFSAHHVANTYYHNDEATLHLDIPSVPTEQYVKLINALAAPAVANYPAAQTSTEAAPAKKEQPQLPDQLVKAEHKEEAAPQVMANDLASTVVAKPSIVNNGKLEQLSQQTALGT